MMFVADNDTRTLLHGVYDLGAERWTVKPLSEKSKAEPALVSYGGKLVAVFMANNQNNSLQFSTYDDETGTWSADAPTGQSGFGGIGVGLAVHAGRLYMMFLSNNGYQSVTLCAYDGVKWSSGTAIGGPASKAAPALVEWDGALHAFFIGQKSDDNFIYHSVRADNGTITGEWNPADAPGESSRFRPAVTEFNGLLTLMYATNDSSPRFRAKAYDGAIWTPPMDTGASFPSAPSIRSWQGALKCLALDSSRRVLQWTGLAGGDRPYSRTPLTCLYSSSSQAHARTDLPVGVFSGNSSYTVEAWVSLKQISGARQYVAACHDVAGTGAMALALKDQCFAGWRGDWVVSSITRPVPDRWYHLALAYDGATGLLSLFVDGVLESTAISRALVEGTGPFLIGAASSGSGTANRLSGNVRSVAVWTEARASDQILSDLFAVPRPPQPRLLAFWDFARATPRDVSGNKQSLTLEGKLSWAIETSCTRFTGGSLDCGTAWDLAFSADQPFTIETWIWLDSPPDDSKVVVSRPGSYSLEVGPLGFIAHGPSMPGAGGSTRPQAGRWYHVALVYTVVGVERSIRLHVNGNLDGGISTTAPPGPPPPPGSLQIAFDNFRGGLANVRVWRRALASDEVRAAMTQSPIGISWLVANYDLTHVPLQDTTQQHEQPVAEGSLETAAVEEVVSRDVAASMLPIDSDISMPYFPAQPEDLVRLSPDLVPRNIKARPAIAKERMLSDAQVAELVDSYRAALPAEIPEAQRELWVSRHRERVAALCAAARANPDAAFPGGRVYWKRDRDQLVLRHRAPDGTITDLATADPASFTPVQLWWIEFTLTIICGVAALFGVGPGDLARRAVKYLTKNPALLEIVAAGVDIGVAITPSTLFAVLSDLFDSGYLIPFLKTVMEAVSWWGVAMICARLLAYFIPGAQALAVAQLIANLALLVIQLTILIMNYPEELLLQPSSSEG
jgi:hypothetical protein